MKHIITFFAAAIFISAVFFTVTGATQFLRGLPGDWAVRWVIAAVLWFLLSAVRRGA